MSDEDVLEAYATRLRAGLSGMNLREREDIVDEIRAHVQDRVQEFGLTTEEALRRLGPAEALAADYCRGVLARRARRSFSPWVIFRAAYAWAMTGVHGMSVFLVASIGYTLGASFILCGILKPLFPAETGFWIGPDVFQFGFQPGHIPEGREVLGQWFTQVSLLLGVLAIAGTTVATRAMLPRFRKWRTSAQTIPHAGSV